MSQPQMKPDLVYCRDIQIFGLHHIIIGFFAQQQEKKVKVRDDF